jgi:hypothetical protein
MNNADNRKEYVIRFRVRDGQIKSGKRFGVSAAQVIYEATNEPAIVELLSCRSVEDANFQEMVSAGQARTWTTRKSAWDKQTAF